MRKLLTTASVLLLVTVVTMAPALAGGGKSGERGGGKKLGGTLELVVLESGDGVANHYDRVTFDVSTSATDRPFVGVRCWQGSEWVYDGYVGMFDEYLFDPWLTLDSPYWTEGSSADCEARLFHYDNRGREKILNTLAFPVWP